MNLYYHNEGCAVKRSFLLAPELYPWTLSAFGFNPPCTGPLQAVNDLE